MNLTAEAHLDMGKKAQQGPQKEVRKGETVAFWSAAWGVIASPAHLIWD